MECGWAEGWWESSRSWCTNTHWRLDLTAHICTSPSDHGPVLVELDGEVGHVLQSLVGEGHVHVHVALAAREGARDLQALGLHRREPHLTKAAHVNKSGPTGCSEDVCVHSQL